MWIRCLYLCFLFYFFVICLIGLFGYLGFGDIRCIVCGVEGLVFLYLSRLFKIRLNYMALWDCITYRINELCIHLTSLLYSIS